MSNIKCPFCQQEMRRTNGTHNKVGVWQCQNSNDPDNVCIASGYLFNDDVLNYITRTRKELEQSETCCSNWEKQALDYKAENIALSGELERTRKALDDAKKWLMKIGYLNMLDHGLGSEKMMTDWCKTVALHGLKEIETALEQKD